MSQKTKDIISYTISIAALVLGFVFHRQIFDFLGAG